MTKARLASVPYQFRHFCLQQWNLFSCHIKFSTYSINQWVTRGTLTQVNNYLIRYYDSSIYFHLLKDRLESAFRDIELSDCLWFVCVCSGFSWRKSDIFEALGCHFQAWRWRAYIFLWNPDLCAVGQKLLKLRSLPTLFSLHSYVGLAMAWNMNECSEAQMTFRHHTYYLINKWMYSHFMSLLFGIW